jgi:hypothetical protein
MDEWVWSICGIIGEKPKYSEKIMSKCHPVYHKSHLDWPGIKAGRQWCQAGNWTPELPKQPNTLIQTSFGINTIWKCCGKKECDFKASLPKLCQISCGIITGIKTTEKGFFGGQQSCQCPGYIPQYQPSRVICG